MLKKSLSCIILCSFVLSAGCASTGPKVSLSSGTGEKILRTSHKEMPDWVNEIPDPSGGYMFFVGVSNNFATEKLSKDDAIKNASKRVVNYISILAKDKIEKKLISAGLSGDVINPTEVGNGIEKYVSAGAVSRLKAKKFYWEQSEKPTGIAWKSYVLARLPQNFLDGSFKDAIQNEIQKAQQKQKETNNEIAKKQLDTAVEMLKKMKDAGIAD